MDKVTINNQVVSMRKFVKQAKIHAINKYTKEIKLLQNRRGNENETVKHKRKAERLLSKVAILKKIKPDSISRMALLKAKDWKAVLKQKDVSLDDQCYALLAIHEPLQKEVEKFYSTNFHLVPKIAMLFKDWDEKSKNPLAIQQKRKSKQIRKSIQNMKSEVHINAKEINPNKTPEAFKKKEYTNTQIQSNKSVTSLEKKIHLNESANFSDKEEQNDNKEFKLNYLNNESKSGVNSLETDSASESSDVEEESLKKVSNSSHKQSRFDKNFPITDSASECNDDKKEEKELKKTSSSNRKQSKSEGNFPETDSAAESSDEEEEEQKKNSSSNRKQSKSDENFLETDSAPESSDIEEHEIDKISSSRRKQSLKSIDANKSPSNLETNVKTELACEIRKIQKKINKTVTESQPNNSKITKSTNESLGIQSKLQAIADKTNVNSGKKKQKPSSNLPSRTKLNSSEDKVLKNSFKSIAVLNLNELQDLDEIPIESAETAKDASEESSKRRKDPFFLSESGEVVSESDDNEESAVDEQKTDYQAFKGKNHSNFNRRESNQDFFKKKDFQGDSSQNRNSNFRENKFQKNKRSSHFEDRNNSFNKKDRQDFEFNKNKKCTPMLKDQFKNSETKSFIKGSSIGQFKRSLDKDANSKDNFQKNKPSYSVKKIKSDDKPLHPSWEAKKKLKESAKIKFQGKRIVFGD